MFVYVGNTEPPPRRPQSSLAWLHFTKQEVTARKRMLVASGQTLLPLTSSFPTPTPGAIPCPAAGPHELSGKAPPRGTGEGMSRRARPLQGGRQPPAAAEEGPGPQPPAAGRAAAPRGYSEPGSPHVPPSAQTPGAAASPLTRAEPARTPGSPPPHPLRVRVTGGGAASPIVPVSGGREAATGDWDRPLP